jgi:hypothetical protein
MKRFSVFTLAMVLATVVMAGPASARVDLFAPLDPAQVTGKSLNADASYRAVAESATTRSMLLVQARPEAIDLETATVSLGELERGLALRAHRVSSYTTRSGALVWAGVIEDPASAVVPFNPETFEFDPVHSVMLVKNGDMITANIHFAGEWYKVRPLRSGGHVIVSVDQSAMPPDHPAEYAQLRTIPMRSKPVAAKANTVIRVMVNYTPAAAAATADITGLIDLAMAETNQGYLSSGVQIDAVLAAAALTTYTESGSFSTDLSRYRSTSDGFMDEIHTARNTTAADVSLLVINNGSACGLASSIGSTAATAFAAAYWDCITGYYSFAHEIGHLQSARHDERNDPTKTPYAYGHGYQYAPRKGGSSWRTIMAYDCTRGCPRLNFWSNPNVLYNGVPMGTTATNDNARVLNNTRATVSAFR